MAFTKIESSDTANKGVIGLPDTPGLTASEMQRRFDEIALEVIVPKHNALIDELEAGTAGASIGVKDANDNDTTLQERLDDIAAGGYTKAEADGRFLQIDTAEETYLSQASAEETYLSQEDASDTYLTQTDASDTYLSQASAEDTYLSQSDASDTYLSKTDASSDYLTKTDAASEYLTQDSASGTYLTKTDASDDYLAKTDASTTYLSKTDASSTYVAKETGKGLSTNDYDNTEKNKLAGIEAGANNYVLPVGNLTVLGGVKADGVTFNIDENGVGHAAGGGGGSLNYDDLSNKPQINGITLAGDKSPSELEIALPQLFDTEITSPSDGQIIQYDGTDQVWKNVNYQAQTQADWSESDNTKPDYIKNKPNLATVATSGAYSDLSGTPSLATVATSGSYNDLSNTPTIPAAQVNADWNASSGVAEILNKPTIPDVSTKMNTDGSNAASEVAFSGAFTVGSRKSGSTVGTKSVATGYYPEASGSYSHAEGGSTKATNSYDHAEGFQTTASGGQSHAEGNSSKATSSNSHAEGTATTASASCAHAEGCYTTASGSYSHAEGFYTQATNPSSHAEGYVGQSGSTCFIKATGKGAHAEGYVDAPMGSGITTLASGDGSHAEGFGTQATATGAHAEGFGTQATATGAHAEGRQTTASGIGSHAEGYDNKATGTAAHSEGRGTQANGEYSHAGGASVTTGANYQFVHGNGRYPKFEGFLMNGAGFGSCFGVAQRHDTYSSDTTITDTLHGIAGCIVNTATVTITLETQAMYLLVASAYTLSTGAIYGATVNLITAHGFATGTPNNLAVKASTNAPATITMAANNKLTIKNGATSRATQFQLIRLL